MLCFFQTPVGSMLLRMCTSSGTGEPGSNAADTEPLAYKAEMPSCSGPSLVPSALYPAKTLLCAVSQLRMLASEVLWCLSRMLFSVRGDRGTLVLSLVRELTSQMPSQMM